MSTLIRLYLLLAAFSALVSARTLSSLTGPVVSESAVYNNCSGKPTSLPPNDTASTPFFKPQVRVNPRDVGKNGTGWEEWLVLSQNLLPDGTELIYSHKWARGDPTSANISHQTFISWTHFPNGTFFRQIVHGEFKYQEYADGGFTLSIADNYLTWDPVQSHWNTSINAGDLILQTITENVEPSIPFGPDYKSKQGQISEGFFSRVDIPRGHSDGFVIYPWGLKYNLQSVGSLKHTWSNKVMADTISSYVRGSTYLPGLPPLPVATVTWYQAWDNSGKEVDAAQLLVQPDGGGAEGQVFRLQVTDSPEVLTVATTPKPVSNPLSYTNTELTLPMCGPGADSNKTMTWKAHNLYTITDFVDFSGGHTLYQRVNMTGTLWVDGAAVDIAGGIGIVEIYHR